jgi:glycosyltransferase involved in cell wall biosynthesis
MKVMLLAPGSSIHTIRWANALSEAGMKVVLTTQHDPLEPISPEAKVHRLPYRGNVGYFRNVGALKRLLAQEKPDLMNVHYASGYGTTARFAGFTPTLLSVWGSDVYDFPEKSPMHRWWVRGNLMTATRVASTSQAMAQQTSRVAPGLGEIAITPFGVETDRFTQNLCGTIPSDIPIVIGTVKTLEAKYGIDTFIDSVAVLLGDLQLKAPDIASRIRVRIVGDGPQRTELAQYAAGLGLGKSIQFVGKIAHSSVPQELQNLDIYVALSRLDSESFGVAIIEASACGLPVVVSDVGGLPEVVADGETGIVVPRENPQAAAEALKRLVLDPKLRRSMGQAGRERVLSLYEWRDNVAHMIVLYEKIIADSRKKN